jgi:hypothetical protein
MIFILQSAVWSISAFGALLFVVQLAAHEAGYWIGRRQASNRDMPPEGVGVLVGALLGLLAFVLALTLSFSSERFNERRLATIAETNAIGTAWLRAKAIGQPRGDEIARSLVEYTHLRMKFVQAPPDAAILIEINDRTNALQSAIWKDVSAIVREQPNPVSASLMASLNEVFDMTASARFAFELRLPPQIFWLLIGLALLGMAALGFQLGLRQSRIHGLAAVVALTWTLVIIDILDMAASRIGNLRISAAPYEWTLQGFQSETPPPARQ